jgi:hypothetical protein
MSASYGAAEGEEAEAEAEAEDQTRELFRLTGTVVGKRYYAGAMHSGEMVLLVREPSNPYDRNAIKVTTVSGQQVGHISAKDGMAGMLAPLMDGRLGGGVGAGIEGVIHSQNTYVGYVELAVVGRAEDAEAIRRHLKQQRKPFEDKSTGEVREGGREAGRGVGFEGQW